jgi:hypothetical protein
MISVNEILQKILRRTKRDVAFAGAMVGSVSAMSKLFPEIEKYGRLTVYFYGGGNVWWEWTPCKKHSNPWRNFTKWYHGRPQSESYVMTASDGASFMFRRSDIRSYQTEYGEREKRNAE